MHAVPLTPAVSRYLPSLARSPGARVPPLAARSSPPTLDEAFASLDARKASRVGGTDETEKSLRPFQSQVETDKAERPLEMLRPPTQQSVVAVIGVAPDTPMPPPSLALNPMAPMDVSSNGLAVGAAVAAQVASPAMHFATALVACVFGGALSAFLLACVPTLRAIANAADEIADLAASIREEVPDTLAAVRVSGMELTDCLEEVGELTHDVGSGIKGTGKAIGYTVDTAEAVGKVVGSGVRKLAPEVRKVQERATPAVKNIIAKGSASVDEGLKRSDETLRQNADTEEYSEPVVAAAARATKQGVQYARGAIRAADVARRVGRVVKTVKSVADAGAAEAGKNENYDDSEDGESKAR